MKFSTFVAALMESMLLFLSSTILSKREVNFSNLFFPMMSC